MKTENTKTPAAAAAVSLLFASKIKQNQMFCDCVCFSGVGLLNIQCRHNTILYVSHCKTYRIAFSSIFLSGEGDEKEEESKTAAAFLLWYTNWKLNGNVNQRTPKIANKTATVANTWSVLMFCLRLAVTLVHLAIVKWYVCMNISPSFRQTLTFFFSLFDCSLENIILAQALEFDD